MPDAYVRPGDHRPHDAVGRLVPRNPFRDPIVLFRAFPGLAGQFKGIVPPDHAPGVSDRSTGLSGVVVDCVCGQRSAVLEVGAMVECAGDCGRWFLRTEGEVRVARFEEVGP